MFSSHSGNNKTANTAYLDRQLSQVLVESSTQTLKTILGILLGLASMLGGWILYSSNGFYTPMLFLTGLVMMPLGLILLGTSLTGGFGESPRNILERHDKRREETQDFA